MPSSNNTTLRFWLVTLAAFVAVLWLFRPVLFPFLAGLTIAYFLEPAVSALQKHKIRRWFGALIALSGFLFVVVLIVLLLWPMISTQGQVLAYALPEYIAVLREKYLPWVQSWLSRFSPEDVEKIRAAATQSTGDAFGFLGKALQRIVDGSFVLIDVLALSILTPVTAYYVLRDWDKLTRTVDHLIPRRHYDVIRGQLAEINRTLSGFLRGQAIVCVALGAYYSLGLLANGLQYGPTVGIIAGILTIIPYVGTLFGWVTSVLLACVQFEGDWVRIGLVFSVFLIGQFLEGYLLTPRLVGKRVGLHPIWILFALIAGIRLMGFTGALIAVPTAAVIGVLTRFGIKQYKSSALYK